MNYFDFHIHPTMKSTLREDLPYDVKIPLNAVSGIVGLCTDLPQIVTSQAHISQLQGFENKILGVALYSIESVIAADKTLNEVAVSNSKLKRFVSRTRLQSIAGNQLPAYDYLVSHLLPHYRKPEFNIVDKNTDLDHPDPQKIHVFFVIEGSHSLCNSSNVDFDETEICQNLDKLAKEVPILSMNPTHLQRSKLCNQAYGIQLTNNSAFIPEGFGITSAGQKVIQACFDHKICVDIKHMSLWARFQLFDQIATGKYQNVQPVICTHAGFTGIRSTEIKDYMMAYEQQGNAFKVIHAKPNLIHPNVDHLQRPAPTFNASSINLYDEEIIAIVRNGGLIGISLDRRISGFVSQYDEDPYAFFEEETYLVDKEFFSLHEFNALGLNSDQIGSKIDPAWCNIKDDLLEVSQMPSTLEEFHRQHFMLQVKHFLQVCVAEDIPLKEASRHICIGSDFDGIINPLYCAMNVTALIKLKKYFKKNFKNFLGRYTDSRKWRSQLDVSQLAEDLFFENGKRFLKQRLIAMDFSLPLV